MRKHVGIVSGGFKPFTKGHFFLVQQAAADADKVLLMVSTSSRERPGELPIFWEGQMEIIWNKYLSKAMPNNVEVMYVKNPTSATFETLGKAEEDPNNDDTYILYGDEEDVPKTFPDSSLTKYFPRLMSNSQIEKKAFSRSANIDISGTKMRDYVVNNDVVGFTAGLPEPVQRYGQEIFDILSQSKDKIKQPKAKAPAASKKQK